MRQFFAVSRVTWPYWMHRERRRWFFDLSKELVWRLEVSFFDRKDTAVKFLHYLNTCHVNIKFTIEFEENNAIPFLDILINSQLIILSPLQFTERRLSLVFTRNGLLSHPGNVKLILSERSLFVVCAFASRLCCCDPPWMKWKCYCQKTATPVALLITTLMMSWVRQQNKPRNPTATVPKKEILLVLPYLGLQSNV